MHIFIKNALHETLIRTLNIRIKHQREEWLKNVTVLVVMSHLLDKKEAKRR